MCGAAAGKQPRSEESGESPDLMDIFTPGNLEELGEPSTPGTSEENPDEEYRWCCGMHCLQSGTAFPIELEPESLSTKQYINSTKAYKSGTITVQI